MTISGETTKLTAVRKSTLLGPDALANLREATADGRTQREVIEEGIAMVVQRDRQLAAMDEFVAWASENRGEPSKESQAWADEIVDRLYS